jgi:hypothetical protein
MNINRPITHAQIKPTEYISILDMLEGDLFMAVQSIPSLSMTQHATENHPENANLSLFCFPAVALQSYGLASRCRVSSLRSVELWLDTRHLNTGHCCKRTHAYHPSGVYKSRAIPTGRKPDPDLYFYRLRE